MSTITDDETKLLRELRGVREATKINPFGDRYEHERVAREQRRVREIETQLATVALLRLAAEDAGGVRFDGFAVFGKRGMWMFTDAETGSTFSIPGEVLATPEMIATERDRVRARFALDPAEEYDAQLHGSQA